MPFKIIWTPEIMDAIRTYRAQGLSWPRVADKVGVCVSAIFRKMQRERGAWSEPLPGHLPYRMNKQGVSSRKKDVDHGA